MRSIHLKWMPSPRHVNSEKADCSPEQHIDRNIGLINAQDLNYSPSFFFPKELLRRMCVYYLGM